MVVTPNLAEACALAGVPYPGGRRAARARRGRSSRSARRPSSSPAATATSRSTGSSTAPPTFPIPVERHGGSATHGSGCTHSAALTALLARGESLEDAARGAARHRGAKRFATACRLGAGSGPVDVFDLASVALGEFGLIGELARRGLAEGVGDDTAVLGDGVVVTQDALVEGIHFRLDWTSWRDLGYKAAAVNLSDLAAACAEPEALVVSLGAPPELEVDAVIELYEGLNEAGVAVRGGDTDPGRPAVPVRHRRRPQRARARAGRARPPGDVLVVTGPLGGSAAGLRVLERGLSGFDELVRAHRRPPLRLADARRLAPFAHALIDLSDGIAGDAGHLAEQSGCAIEIELDDLPLFPRIEEVGDEPVLDDGRGLRAARGGPPRRRPPSSATRSSAAAWKDVASAC